MSAGLAQHDGRPADGDGDGDGVGVIGGTGREPDGADGRPPARQGQWFGESAEGAGRFAGVVFNRPIDQVLTYRVPPSLVERTRAGLRVRAPLGRGGKLADGYCVQTNDRPPEGLGPDRIKDLVEVLDEAPLIDAGMLELTRWVADYYACSWGQALDAAVPAGVKKHAGTRVETVLVASDAAREALRAGGTIEPALTTKQAAALDLLVRETGPFTLSDVCRLAKCGPQPLRALRERGLVQTVRRRTARGADGAGDEARKGVPEAAKDERPRPALVLTAEQSAVLERIGPALEGGAFAPFVIHGVTGSGKTEVYLSAIERVVARGREAIVLVPEISLTPQTIRRFRRRFARVAVLHSHLSDAERHHHWRRIAEGEIEVVVGVRSAVFAPTRKLGLIVVDEEHESTFKQETAPRYHARDVAVKRAQMEGAPVLLGSATPSLETWHNAQRGRYHLLAMPSRVGGRAMPEVEVIDLRHEKTPLGGLSETLRAAMARALAEQGQVILLLNRRGFHTFVICPKCGGVVKCHSCDVSLTYHKSRHVMICHTCDAERPCPSACPSCRSTGLHYGGIGTERLEREVQAAFPEYVTRRMDSDTMRAPGSHERTLAAFHSGEVNILLGTQMIAKGLDFPNVTLVGAVNADTSLHLPDFRAAERTFQLVAQVAGRTGRGERPGRVLVQTFTPEHPAIIAATRHDYLAFVESELPERERYGVPPFGRLARVLARGPEEKSVQAHLEALANAFRQAAGPTVRVLGPAPAPIVKIRDLYRFHLQLRCPSPRPLRTLARDVPASLPAPRGVEIAVDVDPVHML